MKFVEIYKLEGGGSQKTIATCSLQNNEVVCEGDENFLNMLKKEGISDYSDSKPKKLFPKDGIKFLENLKSAFKSSYLNASDIQEK